MVADWKTEIAIAWKVLEAVRDADRKHLWSYHLPRVAATEQELRDVEKALGFRIDPLYRAFLGYANGWPDFHHCDDLFGTGELRGGELMEHAELMLSAIDDAVWSGDQISPGDVLPLAVAKYDRNVFAIVKPPHDLSGQVIWFSGEIVERFVNFDEFFLAMVDYNRLQLKRFAEEEARRSGRDSPI